MSEVLGRLQKNIFAITTLSAALAGLSAAYLAMALVSVIFQPESVPVMKPSKTPGGRAIIRSRAFSEFANIITGSFIRGHDIALANQTENQDKQEKVSSISVVGLLAGSPRFARAALKVEGKNEIEEYRIGDQVGGYKLIDIDSNSVLLERQGARTSVYLGGETKTATTKKTAVAEATGDKHKTTISRTQINKMLNDPQVTRFSGGPFYLKGKIMGFKINLLPTNHIFYKLGARSGDIIRRYNGRSLDSQQKMLEILQSLRTTNRATVSLERSGKILDFEFIITD